MTYNIKYPFVTLLMLMGLGLPTLAQAWWNDDWQLRKVIKVDTTGTSASLDQALTDIPVLVRLHVGNFAYFFDVKPDASDLRFIASDDKTPLKFSVERFDQTNQMALIWVKLPKLPANTKTDYFYMYFSNPAATGTADDSGVFPASQVVAYHFIKDKFAQDATAFKNNGEAVNVEPIGSALIGDGAHFNGQAHLRIPAGESLMFNAAEGMDLSLWLKFDSEQHDAWLMTQQSNASMLRVGLNRRELSVHYQAGQVMLTTAPVQLSPAAWHHVAVTINGTKLILLLDGKEAAASEVNFQGSSGDILLGGAADNAHGFAGDLDEVRFDNKGAPPAAFSVAARNQGIDSSLLSYGEDENRSAGGGASYFPIIMKNVTTDGWVVIIILVIMGIISWVIIAVKGLYLRRVSKDNQAFLDDFKRLDGDPATLDHDDDEQERELRDSPVSLALFGKHDHYQSSNIYHIYHRGVHELKVRMGKAAGANIVLTPEAQLAIRASLDAQLVRESQKLNAQMVLLTIAISGGPFLGLLGTVVGVMITFAAIAASGDVNINAIAPGIAAALLATVAGLGVAIPALFGYNYLGTKIKQAVADMQVFVDEFITTLGEHYSR
ncbi:MAG: DUF2341 domain-containing protein [Gammaproteobacteria bacterium]|nr:DUF2341 domain-containing protein [Gammaproteobacteria bacterium]